MELILLKSKIRINKLSLAQVVEDYCHSPKGAINNIDRLDKITNELLTNISKLPKE